MAQIAPLKINSILGGVSPTFYFGGEGSYLTSIGIDPDFPLLDSGTIRGIKTSGVLRPVAYESFDGAPIDGNPIAILVAPQQNLVYVVLENGTIVSYTSGLGGETEAATVTGANAEGAFIYNNNIYITGTESATFDDMARYGPLDGSPGVTNAIWTGATLGAQVAMADPTYPSLRGSGNYPKHWGMQIEDTGYVLDFDDASSDATFRGKGLVHAVRTKFGTVEGDTDDGSAYADFRLPFGYRPTAIGQYDVDLVVAAIKTTDSTLNQGDSELFFFETSDTTWYRRVVVPEPFVTALLNVNGTLYAWGGKLTATGGYSVYQYSGSPSIRELVSFDEGHPPPPGAVVAMGDKVLWGSFVTYPANAAVVWAWGSKDKRIPAALHCVARSTAAASSSDGMITALAVATQESNAKPGLVIGWRDSANHGLDKLSTTYQTHFWHSELFAVNRKFRIRDIRFGLGTQVAANMTLDLKVYTDDGSSNEALTTINVTNDATKRHVKRDVKIEGINNFFVEFKWSGTALLPVLLPIEITMEVFDQ